MTEFTIHKFKESDISRVADIHKSSLPNDFLPSLGTDFLMNIFYPAILSSQNAETFIAFYEESVVGFIVVSLNSSSLLRGIVLYQFLPFIYLLVKSAFSSYNQFKMVFEVFLSGFQYSGDKYFGEIYIIAVDKIYQGRGVGKMLVHHAEEFLISQHFPGMKIKTLKANQHWISFFQKKGWKISSKIKIANKEYFVLSTRFE